jgi:hypothetical protein
MHTLHETISSDKSAAAARRLHRRAMTHTTTPAQRARYVAESITLRQDEGRGWSWSEYGLQENVSQQALVTAALAALR